MAQGNFVLSGDSMCFASTCKAQLYYPISKPWLRDDDVLWDSRHSSTNGKLASWKGATFGKVRNGGTGYHQGWDFFALPGTPCFAISHAVVVRAFDDGADHGKQILLKLMTAFEYGRAAYAFYSHLDSIAVKEKQFVYGGELIGRTGISGTIASTCPRYPHLHFEVREVHPVKAKSDPTRTSALEGRRDPSVLYGDPSHLRLVSCKTNLQSLRTDIARAVPLTQ